MKAPTTATLWMNSGKSNQEAIDSLRVVGEAMANIRGQDAKSTILDKAVITDAVGNVGTKS